MCLFRFVCLLPIIEFVFTFGFVLSHFDVDSFKDYKRLSN